MLNYADMISAIAAVLSFIVMTIPLFKPPPDYPLQEIYNAGEARYDGSGIELMEAFKKLNRELYDAWLLQRRCTGWGLMLLVLSVVWGLVGAALS